MEKSIYLDKHIYIIEEKEGMNLREHSSIEKWLEWEKWRGKLCNYILLSKIIKSILKKFTFGLLHSLFLYKLWIKIIENLTVVAVNVQIKLIIFNNTKSDIPWNMML